MRHFTSYGPPDAKADYTAERRDLVEQCVMQLLGRPGESAGHYFTIWGPRQTGKTWIMRQAVNVIRERYGDRFVVGSMTLQGVIEPNTTDPLLSFFDVIPELFRDAFRIDAQVPRKWGEWRDLFAKEAGVFDRPVILLLDEFDSLPPALIDHLVAQFRKMYLTRDAHWLHGLALIGVRAVLGVESPRGSPFNVQRSMHVPNLKLDEVVDLFAQYQAESGQVVEPEVVDAVCESTRGQPGLVGWFGELITEKYNPGVDKTITKRDWERVYSKALYVEWNNTLLNLGKKAREPYRAEVMRLFTDPNVTFAMEEPWCSYLYMNGIIENAPAPEGTEIQGEVCRFSSPFVQRRLYSGFTSDMFGHKGPLPPIEIGDWMNDVFTATGICVPKLLERYRGYLKRLSEKNIDPWVGQPRRQDLHYTEAVGHFHLYAWLQNALVGRVAISPEFPTGNGKVDLLLQSKWGKALIEVKSFTQTWALPSYAEQAAGYAKKLGLMEATVVVFAPTNDETVLAKLASEVDVDGVHVTTVPFGWV